MSSLTFYGFIIYELDREQQKMVAKISFEVLRIDVGLFIAGHFVKGGEINPLLVIVGGIGFIVSLIICLIFTKEVKEK